jgi:hypothetical protein
LVKPLPPKQPEAVDCIEEDDGMDGDVQDGTCLEQHGTAPATAKAHDQWGWLLLALGVQGGAVKGASGKVKEVVVVSPGGLNAVWRKAAPILDRLDALVGEVRQLSGLFIPPQPVAMRRTLRRWSTPIPLT